MALAQRLNELALAHSEGLLHDDEYRLLRQNLFEQHSTTDLTPVQPPLVPLASPGYTSSSSSTPRRIPVPEHRAETLSPRPPPTHSKIPVTIGVTNLLRRATGRKAPVSPNYIDHGTIKAGPTTSNDTPKRGILPRLHRKASDFFSSQTDRKRPEKTTKSKPLRPPTSPPGVPRTQHVSSDPTRPVGRTMIPAKELFSTNDIFDDGPILTAKDIRAAIIATETEAHSVIEAFDNLELTTSYRIYQKTARRLPSATPAHANVLIEGKEWRDHSFQPPPSPMLPAKKSHRRRPPTLDISDSSSVKSRSSVKTTLSQSKSISSLRSKQHPGSPLSPRFPPPSPSIHRKNSVSSIASQTPSARKLGVSSSISLSRSTGHLPLSMLAESDSIQFKEGVGPDNLERAEDEDIHPEVLEIRRRRRDVSNRYEQRIEYLRAKLKGAELHEKLLRK